MATKFAAEGRVDRPRLRASSSYSRRPSATAATARRMCAGCASEASAPTWAMRLMPT
jgi:hypothetical protein